MAELRGTGAGAAQDVADQGWGTPSGHLAPGRLRTSCLGARHPSPPRPWRDAALPLTEHAHVQVPIGPAEGQAGSTRSDREAASFGNGEYQVMGSMAEDPATVRPREWLALPGGCIRPVVSVPGPGGIAELLAYGAKENAHTPADMVGPRAVILRGGHRAFLVLLGAGGDPGAPGPRSRSSRWRQTVMTTFPRACPCSRYRMALGASLSG